MPKHEINEKPIDKDQYRAFQSQGLKLLARWIYLEEQRNLAESRFSADKKKTSQNMGQIIV